MMRLKIAIIIPCFNEEASISEVISEINLLKNLTSYDVTPLIINDCSTDGTLEVIKNLECEYLNLSVNLGIGGAVQSGYKYALLNNYDIAIQLDGDGQHPVDQISNLIEPIIRGSADVVIGSRFINKDGFQSSTLRRAGIRYFKNLNKFLLNVTVLDSTSGYRAINRKALTMVCKYYPDTYPEPEAIVLYSLNKLKIEEIPVIMKERRAGQSSISSANSLYY
ncbi:MAG TPA: glycosyltransferase family 2 protein, partial [Nitrosopumilaceae archaeon]|nr:glycosyltransferase family 2 protein [Nitrosopumilaceae archaeon]